ncbi:histidine kinase [Sporolactobacillus sp. CPB3-1]|uniref:histidine kinase n=1 Tax=Sporolactobacillus mangiferae TaxID=2940498 RepID=A0ABT0MDP5_9BACL|nr:ATP-binding protein [Sporolactobacillus mangiferae]MCL1632440.1 histidine kinase [Sporolactobacillus mangiferae]
MITDIYNKRWVRSLLILVALVYSMVLAIHFMMVILDRPYVGIYTVTQGEQVSVRSVAPYSWASSAGIKPGDMILGVDGKSPAENRMITHFSMVGQAKSLQLAKGDSVFFLTIDNRVSKGALFFYLMIPLAFFTTCFVAVLFLYLRKESGPVVRSLSAFLVAISPVLLEMAANARHDSWSLRLTSVAIVFSMIFLVHFLRAYFSVCGFLLVSNWMLGCLYLCGTFIVINSCLLTSREVSAYYLQELVFSVFIFGLLCIQLTRLYYQIRTSEYSRIIHLLIAGAWIAMFPFIAFYAVPNMFIRTSLVPVEWTTPWLIMLPITLCYIVLSSTLIDMSFYIGRLGYYCAISFVGTLLILFGFLVLVERDINQNPVEVTQLGVACFIISVMILYFKDYMDDRLMDYLHPKQKVRQEALKRFLQESTTEYTLRHVDMMLRRTVLTELPMKAAGLLLVNQNGDAHAISSSFQEAGPVPVSEDKEGRIRKTCNGFTVWIKKDKNRNVLFTCRWMNPGRTLNLDEHIWFETLVSYARVIVDNLYKIEGLMQEFQNMEDDRDRIPKAMNRWLFSISEQERAHLSRDMHDTNIQDQLAIAREIDAAVRTIGHPETAKRLRFIRERILDNANEMRRTIREWYPAEIFHGRLEQALDALFRRVNLSADFRLETHVAHAPSDLAKETGLCVFRAAQELLSNAIKHARATQVQLTLTYDGSQCNLLYKDNGVGLHESAIDSLFSTTGLSGLVSRVEGMNGSISFGGPDEGQTVHGLSVFIQLPLSL